MVYKEHLVELWVNGNKVEFESQESVNIRFNNVLFDPTKITSSQAEYSFEFELPCTPKNNKIFDYANNLSKLNKFHTRYDAELYADGTIIFRGTLTISSIKNKMYHVNLVSIKTYSLDDIFGDAVMTEIPWYIPFDGGGDKTSGYTIDYYNDKMHNLEQREVCFPLVSYGAFQKQPYNKDDVASDYTSKYDLDKYNLWYMESFPPSLNLMETVRKAFEWKGYKVQGDAFTDYFLRDIYMSTNLADEQSPNWNLGNPKFGSVELSTSWVCPQDVPPSGIFDTGTTYGTVQELKFPYFKSGSYYWDCKTGDCIGVDPDYNFKNVRVYDMLSSAEGGTVTVSNTSYMYQPNERCIVIPADGFYEIEMSLQSSLLQSSDITASQWVHDWDDHTTAMTMSVSEQDITFHPDFKITTPLEIQLVRNYDEDIELIKGKNNINIHDGYPDNTTEMNRGRYNNYSNWITCFPHEKLGSNYFVSSSPTKTDELGYYIYETDTELGYAPYDGDLFCYDPIVSHNFICGWTSMGNKNGGGTAAVIKNGYSWNRLRSEKQDAMYTQNGYQVGQVDSSYNPIWSSSTHNRNTFPNSPTNYFSQTSNSMNGNIYCLVRLNKNDILRLFAVQRDYKTTGGTSVSYATSANVSLKIHAASPNTLAHLRSKNFGYHSDTEFDVNLRVTNFLNNNTKVSEWLSNVKDAFNFDIIQDGETITINSKKKYSSIGTAVDIDDRTNSSEAESSMIDYPMSMAVKYKIDTEEHGFYKSVPVDKIDEENWKEYGDSGFSIVVLNDDSYVTTKNEKSLQFSYTWYDNFNWIAVDNTFQEDTGTTLNLRIPVISKEEYMIDGYDYTESLKHDGYGLPQRFWFFPNPTMAYVWTRTYPPEKIEIYEPINVWNGGDKVLNLSYKTTEKSILTEYFNITPYLASNYVQISVYLTPIEYNRLKNGALVHFDSDLYEVVDIEGYDPTGFNPTTLKLMKKVV